MDKTEKPPYLCDHKSIQDLTNNRDRIIKMIKKQSSSQDAVKGVMTKMAAWLSSREDIQEMKPLAKNIDKFTSMCIASWIKYDYRPFTNTDGTKNYTEYNDFLEHREEVKRGSHSTFH